MPKHPPRAYIRLNSGRTFEPRVPTAILHRRPRNLDKWAKQWLIDNHHNPADLELSAIDFAPTY